MDYFIDDLSWKAMAGLENPASEHFGVARVVAVVVSPRREFLNE